jgi:hypothetical protein
MASHSTILSKLLSRSKRLIPESVSLKKITQQPALIFLTILKLLRKRTIFKGFSSSRREDTSLWSLRWKLVMKILWFLKITLDTWELNWPSRVKNKEVKICTNLSFKLMCHTLEIGWPGLRKGQTFLKLLTMTLLRQIFFKYLLLD